MGSKPHISRAPNQRIHFEGGVYINVEAYDSLVEQVEALTGRNQFLSTEQVRADIAETRVRELEEQLEAANARKQELWDRLLDMEGKYLDTHERLEKVAAWYGHDLDAALGSNPASSPHKCDDHASFDRTLCACGDMHYYCGECGKQLDPCNDSVPAKERQ